MQSSAHKESLYSPETIRADNDFTVSLYNISNDQIKPGLGTITPNEREELVHASKEAIESYIDRANRKGSKYGDSRIMALVAPLQFSHQGTHGSFLYTD